MQLLLSRKQSPHWMGGVQFKLWARFELTEEEDALIKKYQVRNALVTLGNTRRDIRLAALYALPVPFVIYLIFHGIYGFGGSVSRAFALWYSRYGRSITKSVSGLKSAISSKAGILPAEAF